MQARVFPGGTRLLSGVFAQAIAGGAALALVAHAMIPEAIEEADSLIVLPTVAGFLYAFYLSGNEAFTRTVIVSKRSMCHKSAAQTSHDDSTGWGDPDLRPSSSMARLIDGYRAFRGGRWQVEATNAMSGWPSTAKGLKRSWSRAATRVRILTIFDASPGELFVVRNIAAIVPPLELDTAHHGTTAAIAFGVCVLNVRNILVLGHAQCGGVAAALDKTIGVDVPSLRSWIDLLEPAVRRIDHEAHAPDTTQLERSSVLLSIERLMTYPFVAKRVNSGELEINGARFGISDGILELFDAATKRFCPI